MLDDAELLRQYATEGSEDAFTELVSRHLPLVYSAALRQLQGDAHLAKDVTQTVFIDLARKAASLTRHPVLSGWLYLSTRMAAATALRAQQRRQNREQTMFAMQSTEVSPQPDWTRLSAVLDSAMAELAKADRDAVLLRFFERKELKRVGAALGISEDAARMRVTRALEKLRSVLNERGVVLPATALGTLITGEALNAVPAGLATQIAGTAVISAAAISGTGIGVFKLMSMTKAQFGILGLIVAASVATPLLMQRVQNRLQEENRALRQEINLLRQTNESLTLTRADPAELDRLRQDQAELLRLRGEVNVLRRQPKTIALQPAADQGGVETNTPPASAVTKLQASIQARVGSGQTLIMGGWPGTAGRRVLMLATPQVGGDNSDEVQVKTTLIEVPEALLAQAGLEAFQVDGAESTLQQIVPSENAAAMLKTFGDSKDASMVAQFKLITKDGQQAQMAQTDKQVIEGKTWELGPAINIVPKISEDKTTVDVTFNTEITRPNPTNR